MLNIYMVEEHLITLLQHADGMNNQLWTFYTIILSAVATFCMTKTYEEKFKILGKTILSIALLVWMVFHMGLIVENMHIYNALIDQLAEAGREVQNWTMLFGPDGVYVHKHTLLASILHSVADIALLSIVWWREIQPYSARFLVRLKRLLRIS